MIMQFCAHDDFCGCTPRRLLADATDGLAAAGVAPGRGQGSEASIAPATGPNKILSGGAPHRIDVHHHLVPPGYIQAINRHTEIFMPIRNWTVESSLADMDQAGVATAILSLTTPGLWFGDVAECAALARACNDYGTALAQKHPGRFGLFAAMPLPDIDAALAEVEYALDVLKADGIGLFTSYDNRWLGDPHFAPLFEELDRRRAVVHVHPTSNACCTNLIPLVTDATIEYGTDTTRTIASLIFSGAALKYPNVKLIFSHAGGTMPFLIERFFLLSRTPQARGNVPGGVLPILRGFHYDTAQAANPVALEGLLKIVPVSQLMYGTDVPYRTCVDHVTGLAGCDFSEAERRAIDRDNAARLLPRYA
jgi:predicted TIM-barrel fold metal-dependent hydrolase